MATNSPRLLSLATFLLSGLLLGLPWSLGGKSPVGLAVVVLIPILAGICDLVGRWPAPLLRPTLPLLVAALLVGVSAIHTIHPDQTAQALLLLLSYLLAAALALHAARELPWAGHALLASICVAGASVSLVGTFRLVAGHEGGLYAQVLTGPFEYPNAAAGFLVLTAGAALALARENVGIAYRAVILASALLSILGLALTRSQGAMLAAAIGFTVWAAMDWNAWWPQRRAWAAVGALGLLLTITLAPNRLLGLPLRLWSLFGAGAADSSYMWRLQIWKWTLAMVRDHPWWGVGPGAFPVALTHYQRIPYISGYNPHDLYLEVAAEYGLPAAILVLVALGIFLGRMGSAIRRTPVKDPARGQPAVLLATLVAFAVHSLVDLDWSFPANAMAAAIMIGLAWALVPHCISNCHSQMSSPVPGFHRGKLQPGSRSLLKAWIPVFTGMTAEVLRNGTHLRNQALADRRVNIPSRSGRLWNGAAILLLGAAALLSLGRYYATTLVEAGRYSLVVQDAPRARYELGWALRLNPLSFPAHQSMALVRLRSGDPGGALEVADRAARLAPLDPNGQFLAGEIAASVGRWDLAEERFQAAVDRAPAAQLRFHAGLIEAAANGGKPAEARNRYERATAIFTPERVVSEEGRCLAPGDRYLLARLSRLVARLYAEAGDASRQQMLIARAGLLAEPDHRGICITQGRSGQTSPEATTESFWRALVEGGWSQASQFLAPGSRPPGDQTPSAWEAGEKPRQARVAWIAALSGGEYQASLRFQLEIEDSQGDLVARCAQADTRLIGRDWFLERPPAVQSGPCPE